MVYKHSNAFLCSCYALRIFIICISCSLLHSFFCANPYSFMSSGSWRHMWCSSVMGWPLYCKGPDMLVHVHQHEKMFLICTLWSLVMHHLQSRDTSYCLCDMSDHVTYSPVPAFRDWTVHTCVRGSNFGHNWAGLKRKWLCACLALLGLYTSIQHASWVQRRENVSYLVWLAGWEIYEPITEKCFKSGKESWTFKCLLLK